jgi:hypothetical protein
MSDKPRIWNARGRRIPVLADVVHMKAGDGLTICGLGIHDGSPVCTGDWDDAAKHYLAVVTCADCLKCMKPEPAAVVETGETWHDRAPLL